MTNHRFTLENDEKRDADQPIQGSAFLLMSTAPMAAAQSSMQWLYQRLYEEAQKASKPAPTRDLFAIMN